MELASDLADKLMDGQVSSFKIDGDEAKICGGDKAEIMKELKKYSR